MNVDKIITEAIDNLVNEADKHRPGYFDGKPDRHREGYWKERWAKQKSEKEKNDNKSAAKKPVKKDRHKPGYYRKYNKQHPERLNRGFTKGFNNGNVDDGRIGDNGVGKEIFPGVYIIGYDELGRPVTNSPLSDLLRNKESEWHDDDWCESGPWDGD